MHSRVIHGLTADLPPAWEDATVFRFAIRGEPSQNQINTSTLLVTKQLLANKHTLHACLQAGTRAGETTVGSGAGVLADRECIWVDAVVEASETASRIHILQAAVATQSTAATVFTFSSSGSQMAGMPNEIGFSRVPRDANEAGVGAPLLRPRLTSLHGLSANVPSLWEDWSLYRFLVGLEGAALAPTFATHGATSTLTPTAVIARLGPGLGTFDEDNTKARHRDATFKVVRSAEATHQGAPMVWQDVIFTEPRAGLLVTQRQYLILREKSTRVLVTLTGPQKVIQSMATTLGLAVAPAI